MEPTSLTIASYFPDVGAFESFASDVEERTNGKISFEIYSNSSLVPGDQVLGAIKSGVADIGIIPAAENAQELPLTDWTTILGSLPEPSFPAGMMQGAAALHETYTTNEALAREYERHNVKVLTALYPAPRYSMMCNEAIDRPEDAHGLRIRTAGTIWEDEVKALGMVPVNLPTLEVYQGLQRGVIDCAIFPPTSYVALGIWEVAKFYYPMVYTTYMSNPIGISLDTWQSLPADAQRILLEEVHTLWKEFVKVYLGDFKEFATKGPSEHGVVVKESRGLNRLLAAYQDDAIASAIDDAKNQGGSRNVYDSFSTSLSKWREILSKDLGYSFPDVTERTPKSVIQSYANADELDMQAYFERVKDELFSTQE